MDRTNGPDIRPALVFSYFDLISFQQRLQSHLKYILLNSDMSHPSLDHPCAYELCEYIANSPISLRVFVNL